MRFSIDIFAAWLLVALLSACASTPVEKPARAPVAASASLPPGAAKPISPSAPGSTAPVSALPAAPPSPRETADFNRAVGFMRSGNSTEAELEFKQMTLAYPSLSAPYVNLGILYRKAGRLDLSEEALQSAVQRKDSSAVAWNELGATQRLRGEFPQAAASYERAIAADAGFAPAYRNLGVVSDLYLGDPERALAALERYKELTGEDRPVTSWIAELRQRTGKPAVKPGAAGSAGASGASAAPAATPAGSSSSSPPSTAPGTPPPAPAAVQPKSGD